MTCRASVPIGEQLPKLLACPATSDQRQRNELNEVLAT